MAKNGINIYLYDKEKEDCVANKLLLYGKE